LDDMHDADFVVYELARPSGSGHGEASSSAVGLEQTLDHQSTLMSTAHKRTSKSIPTRGGDDSGSSTQTDGDKLPLATCLQPMGSTNRNSWVAPIGIPKRELCGWHQREFIPSSRSICYT
jgi:hypothetical protein